MAVTTMGPAVGQPSAGETPPSPPSAGGSGDLVGGPLAEAVAEVGDRWTLLVIAALLDGALRFGELQERLGAIAPNVLSQRLRDLQDRGLVLAEPYSDRPPRYAYELGARGQQLAGVLRLLARWAGGQGEGQGEGEGEAVRHEACGTPLERAWYCPTCNETVPDPAEEAEVRFL